MENGKWRMANGKWQMANGEWKISGSCTGFQRKTATGKDRMWNPAKERRNDFPTKRSMKTTKEKTED